MRETVEPSASTGRVSGIIRPRSSAFRRVESVTGDSCFCCSAVMAVLRVGRVVDVLILTAVIKIKLACLCSWGSGRLWRCVRVDGRGSPDVGGTKSNDFR